MNHRFRGRKMGLPPKPASLALSLNKGYLHQDCPRWPPLFPLILLRSVRLGNNLTRLILIFASTLNNLPWNSILTYCIETAIDWFPCHAPKSRELEMTAKIALLQSSDGMEEGGEV
jgi:hypothetical protein